MSVRGRIDEWFEARRRREIAEEPRLEWQPDAREKLEAAGFQPHWRVHRGKAHGRWADGTRVVLDAEEFIDRFMERVGE